jgi:hypothetical protein
MLHIAVVVLLLVGLAHGMAFKRGDINSTLTGHRPSCPRIVQLPRGVNSVRRDQAIMCGFQKVDADRNGLINGTEYTSFVAGLGRSAVSLAPDWDHIHEWCDCNGDGLLAPDEAKHATATCLESNFWIDLVHEAVCEH